MEQAGISIAIVVREDREGLTRLLRGIERTIRKHPPATSWPILIIDNASSLEFRRFLREIVDQSSQIKLYLRDHNSMSEARQQALQEARTQWLVFLDSDVRVLADWAKDTAEELQLRDNDKGTWGWSGPTLYATTSAVGALARYFPAHRKTPQAQEVRHLPTSQLFLRREPILACGGFPEGFHRTGEDMALSLRVHRMGGKFMLTPHPRVLHAQRGNWRSQFQRLRRYGSVHGTLAWSHPAHLVSRQFLPLYLSGLAAAAAVEAPFITLSVCFGAWALGAVFHRGLRTIWIAPALTAYAVGTMYGLLLRSERKK